MKKLFVLCIALVFAISWAGMAAAADWIFTADAAYQLGNYRYSMIYGGGEAVYDFSAAAPPVRLSAGIAKGPWQLGAFATTWIIGDGECNDEWASSSEGESDYGLVGDFGADIAYLFDVGPIRVGPSAGLRNTLISTGVWSTSGGVSAGSGYGIQTVGPRIGAEALASIGDRLSIGASLGFSPVFAMIEFIDASWVYGEGVPNQHNRIRHLVSDPAKTLGFDAEIAASYRVIPALEIAGGFHYMASKIEIAPGGSIFGVDGYSASSAVFHVGLRASF